MKFEKIISNLSATIAGIAVFVIASGMYLSFKGFVLTEAGQIVLVKNANAMEPNTPVKIASNIVLPKGKVIGSPNAPITIYEFSSLNCFHCADFHNTTLPKIKADYIQPGEVKVVFIDFPIDAKSMQASLMSKCVTNDKYFDFLSLLFKKQKEWGLATDSTKLLTKYAELNGVDSNEATACLKNSKVAQEIITNRQNIIDYLKIMGTPSLLIVKGDNRELYQGAPSYTQLKEIIDKKLNEN